jgi:hypothetical protein
VFQKSITKNLRNHIVLTVPLVAAQALEVTTLVPSRLRTVSRVSQVPEMVIHWTILESVLLTEMEAKQ